MGIGALRGKANYRRPAYLLILMDILGFCLLYASNDYNINIIYTGLAILALFSIMYTILVRLNMGDKFIILMVFMLLMIGVLMLCRINIEYGFRQIVWIIVGGVAFFAAYIVYYNVKIWNKLWLLYFLVGTFLFVFTLLFGNTVNGSKNWVSLGPVTFQPSEIIKILYIMCLACYYSESWKKPLFNKISVKWQTLAI